MKLRRVAILMLVLAVGAQCLCPVAMASAPPAAMPGMPGMAHCGMPATPHPASSQRPCCLASQGTQALVQAAPPTAAPAAWLLARPQASGEKVRGLVDAAHGSFRPPGSLLSLLPLRI